MEFIEVFFPFLFLSYLLYSYSIAYNLIPMIIEIMFLYFIQRKNLLKTTITIFLSQGIILGITYIIYDILHSSYKCSTFLEFLNTIESSSIIFDIVPILLSSIILIFINYFVYKDELKKNFTKQLATLLCGTLLNLIILLILMIKFPKVLRF